MRIKVTKNDEVIIVTNNFKHASRSYNDAIYKGKSGDIVRMYCRQNPNDDWELVKKDWL